MGYLEFLEAEFGKNWVVARRSESIVRHYGSDVTCLSQQRYAEAARKYRRAYGDPHDAVRRELYQAAKALLTCEQGDLVAFERLHAAVEAEAREGVRDNP